MVRVREFRPADLPMVVGLYEEVARSGGRVPTPGLLGYFERTLLDHPWVDPSAPSIVYEAADGEVTAFVASFPLRLRVERQPALAVVSGCLVASPRAPGTGGLVSRRQLSGPQELSLTDGGTGVTRGLWSALGGQPLLHGAVEWGRTLGGSQPTGRSAARPALGRRAAVAVADVLGTARREIAYEVAELPSGAATRDEVLTPELLLAAVAEIPFRVRPDYDLAYLSWLFALLDEAASARGPLVRHLVTSSGLGRPEGWYVYRLAPSGCADVLALVGRRGSVGRVLDHLLADASNRGAREVRGRLEPASADVPARPDVELHRGRWSMVHTRDPLLLGHLGAPTTTLTRLDGETWMSHGDELD